MALRWLLGKGSHSTVAAVAARCAWWPRSPSSRALLPCRLLLTPWDTCLHLCLDGFPSALNSRSFYPGKVKFTMVPTYTFPPPFIKILGGPSEAQKPLHLAQGCVTPL